MVKCQKCGREIYTGDGFTLGAQIVCEDCYIKATHRIQTCDPLATRQLCASERHQGLKQRKD